MQKQVTDERLTFIIAHLAIASDKQTAWRHTVHDFLSDKIGGFREHFLRLFFGIFESFFLEFSWK